MLYKIQSPGNILKFVAYLPQNNIENSTKLLYNPMNTKYINNTNVMA